MGASMTRLRRAAIAALLAVFLAVVPISAEELPPGAQVFPITYVAGAVEVSTSLTFQQGATSVVAGQAYWPQTGEPITEGVVVVMLHWPTAPGTTDHARAMDVAVFAFINPDGHWAAPVNVPYLLAPDEFSIEAQGQFNLFTIRPADLNALMVIGHADVWLPVVVTA